MIDEKKLIKCLAYDMSCFETEDKKISRLYVRVDDMVRMIKGQPKIGEWIPCSEPPKHSNEVLIFNGKSYSVGYYDGKTWVNAIHPVEWQEIHHE